jgi:YebC/PmpR family DNA-binding regulatory protein
MAKHSKWHNIKHRKAAQDAKKSKVYARIGKLIQMAARQGSDPSLNPVLATLLIKAKEASLPKDVVQRAIEKWAGTGEWDQLMEMFYEGYGPWGSAIYVKCIASNVNRTSANVRAVMVKYGGNMAEPGAVKWQFEEKGEIWISEKILMKNEKWKTIEEIHPIDIELLEVDILETSAENYEIDEESVRIVTSRDDFVEVKRELESKWYKCEEADLQFLPTSTVELDDATYTKFERLIEMIEEDEDVDMVWHNVV